MRKSPLFLSTLIVLSAIFVLPGVQAHPQHKISPTPPLQPGKNYFATRLTDHNPPTLTAAYFAPSPAVSSAASVRPSISVTVDFAKPPKKGYKAHEVTLLFYQYVQGAAGMPSTVDRIDPASYFDLSSFKGKSVNGSLKKAPFTKKGKSKGVFDLPLKMPVVKSVHLIIIESYNYVYKNNMDPSKPLVSKGPVFTTLLLEPQ